MIPRPRTTGPYQDRDLDCQAALEPSFLKYAYGNTAFVDLANIKKDILARALRSGWSEAEVDAALSELGRCYARRIPLAAASE